MSTGRADRRTDRHTPTYGRADRRTHEPWVGGPMSRLVVLTPTTLVGGRKQQYKNNRKQNNKQNKKKNNSCPVF